MTTAAPFGWGEDSPVRRLQEDLRCRDEVIVALQHVVRDLRHELENLRVDRAYADCSLRSARRELPRTIEHASR